MSVSEVSAVIWRKTPGPAAFRRVGHIAAGVFMNRSRVVALIVVSILAATCLAPAAGAQDVAEAREPVALAPFDYPRNFARISEAGLAILDDATLHLRERPGWLLVIDGHAGEAERAHIAWRRALNCRNYLVNERGVEPDRLVVRAFRDRYPLATWQDSQRVELTLVPPGHVANATPVRHADLRPAWSGRARALPLAPSTRGLRAVAQTGHAGSVTAVAVSRDGVTSTISLTT
jgi:hypothetical protein